MAKRKRNKPNLLAIGAVLLALLLRMAGTKWGLPSPNHLYSYHPDEIILLGAASNVDIFRLQLDPGFYNYGTFYIFILSILGSLGIGLGYVKGESLALQLAHLHILGRIATVLMGTATVWLLYILGRRLYSETAGIAGAYLLAVAPLHQLHSHYMTVDVPATFLVSLSLFFLVLSVERPRDSLFFWGGFFAGLAIATKYNTGLVLLPFIYLLFKQGFSWKRLLLLGGGTVIAFLLGCPGALLNFPEFKKDFLYELRHAKMGHGDLFASTGPGWLYHLRTMYYALGAPLLLLILLGIFSFPLRRGKGELPLLLFLIPYYLLISSAQVRFARYLMPILPPCILFAVASFPFTGKGIQRKLSLFVFSAILFYTFLLSLAYLNTLISKDPRDTAGDWLRKNIRTGDKVGLLQLPWFYTPSFIPYNGGKMSEREFYNWAMERDWKVVVLDWKPERLMETKPRFVVVSNFEFIHPLRLKRKEALRFWEILERNYTFAKTFKRELRLNGLSFPFNPKEVPEDILYTLPEIRIYLRK